MNRKINYTYEQLGSVGVFNLTGELTLDNEDDLKLILMRAIHGNDRAVLNLRKVTRLDRHCVHLLKKGYCTSLRLRRPIILTKVPRDCMKDICNCDVSETLDNDWIAGQKGNTA